MLGHTCCRRNHLQLYAPSRSSPPTRDDTPWSKRALASSYASRAPRKCFTSGPDPKVHSRRRHMLYLEARCIYITVKAAGVQAAVKSWLRKLYRVPPAAPSGHLCRAGGKPTRSSPDSNAPPVPISDLHSTRSYASPRAADAVPAGYRLYLLRLFRAVPNYTTCSPVPTKMRKTLMTTTLSSVTQRGRGLLPLRKEDAIANRTAAPRCRPCFCRKFYLPPITDEEVEAATAPHGSKDMRRSVTSSKNTALAQEIINKTATSEVVKALAQGGFSRRGP